MLVKQTKRRTKDISIATYLPLLLLSVTLLCFWSSPLASAGIIKMHTLREANTQISIKISGGKDSYKVTGATPAVIGNGEHTLVLTSQEISIEGDITFFSCSQNELDKLDISKCPTLAELLCYENNLQALDLDKNVNLVKLSCENNQLQQLNLTQNKLLEDLLCVNNNIEQLDLRALTKLKALYCFNNKLTSILLPAEHVIEEVLCSSNDLASIDLGYSPRLTLLECFHNKLTAIDLSQAPHLKKLSAKNNELKALDLTANTELEELYCANNLLEEIKTTANSPLLAITCYKNKLSAAAMSQLMGNLKDIRGLSISITDGGELIAINSANDEGNVCYKSDVKRLKDKGWKVSDFNGSYMDRKEYDGVDDPTVGNTIRLKSAAQQIILTFDVDELELLTVKGAEQKSKETIDQDVLVTYDVTPQAEVVVEGDITMFGCSDNQITELQVAHHSTLAFLLCNDNQLKSLNVSGCPALEELDAHNNQLITIDPTGCTSLGLLDCSSNRIKSEMMDLLISSLPNRESMGEKGSLYVINSINPNEGNICTVDQVTKATTLSWKVYHQHKEGQWAIYPGSTPSGLEMLSTLATPIAIYDTMGYIRSRLEQGYNIVVLNDGSTRKVYKE